jgi:hypothetical protein
VKRFALLICVLAAALAATIWAQTNPHGNDDLDCASCHDEASWSAAEKSARFDHGTTGFPLEGRHAEATCRSCHRDLAFAHVGTSCADCHADPHRLRLGSDCASCHSPRGWTERDEMRQRHDATRFPLVGAHERVDCDACHRDPAGSAFANTPTDCYACHASDYAATAAPPHASSGFGTDCVSCHGVFAASWGSGDFQHAASFPLTGAHAGAACASCHASGYAGTPTECVACHQADYDNATDPAHAAAGFSTDCAACHSTDGWNGASFNHDTSGFPLTGQHRTVTCLECHASGYSGTPTDCVACHQDDFDATTDPAHVAGGYPTDCLACHTTNGWDGASFNHDTSGFPLTGQHRTVTCLECHASGYSGTPTDCIACHQDDYDATTNPAHSGAGFPTDCVTCHTTNGWEPSTWDHDTLFPIYSGRHRNEWNACADCHTVPSNYAVFECIFCHEHSRARTDSEHGEVSGYQYLSTACFECHPRGQGDK